MLFPAYAGVILLTCIFCHILGTFPRICGGDPAELKRTLSVQNFSPHMRG